MIAYMLEANFAQDTSVLSKLIKREQNTSFEMLLGEKSDSLLPKLMSRKTRTPLRLEDE
jgi:hypothetical protein